jgi:hypothetical protein
MNVNQVLLRAAEGGLIIDMQNCLAAGASPDACDIDGCRAVHLASASGDPNAVKMLLDAKADLEWENDDGETALQLAVRLHRNATALVLLSAGADGGRLWPDGRNIIHFAAERGDAHMIKRMVNGGAVPDQKTHGGITPFRLAMCAGHASTVKCLLDECVHVDPADFLGATPNMIALVKAFKAKQWMFLS